MIDNKKLFTQRWKSESIRYIEKAFTSRFQAALIQDILRQNFSHLYIYIETIADFGCGVGSNTAIMARLFPQARVYGFDFAKSGIETARAVYQLDNLTFHEKDITQGLVDTYDLISMFEVLEHIDDWQGLIKKLANITNKYLLFSFPTGRMREYEISGGHLRNFKKKEVELFLQQVGFKPVSVYYAGFPFFSPIFRNICAWLPNTYKKARNDIMSKKVAFAHQLFYVLGRYCSTRKYFGDQFVGLFEKVDNT